MLSFKRNYPKAPVPWASAAASAQTLFDTVGSIELYGKPYGLCRLHPVIEGRADH
jgi:hypothetical protein